MSHRIRIALLALLVLLLLFVVTKETDRARIPANSPAESDLEDRTDPALAPGGSTNGSEPAKPSFQKRPELPAGPGELVVRVTYQGLPAAGATVRVTPISRYGWPAGAGKEGRTDEKGESRFEFPPKTHVRLHAWRGLEVSSVRREWISRASRTVELGLTEVLPVSGYVRDQDGRPVAGADVVLSLAGQIKGPQSFAAAFRAISDEQGRVPIRRAGIADRPYYRVMADGYRTAWGELEREALVRGGFEIVLEKLESVIGRFVDAGGNPVEDVNVMVRETMQAVLSDKDGRFELAGLPDGAATVVVTPPKHERLILTEVRSGRGGADLGDIVLGEGLSISGVVRGEDGSPAGEIYVWSVCETTWLAARAARTDAEGRFTILHLAEGPYKLKVSDQRRKVPGKTDPSATALHIPAGTENVELVLRRRPVIHMKLVDEKTGELAWVLRLTIRATHRGSGEAVEQTIESPRKRRTSGTWIYLEREGEYDVVLKAGDRPEQSVTVTVGPGEFKLQSVPISAAQPR